MSIPRHIVSVPVRIGLSIGVSALLVGGMMHLVVGGVEAEGRPGLLSLILGTGAGWVAGYMLLTLVQTGFRAVRYRLLILAAEGNRGPDLFPTILVTLARNMFVDLLPARLGELSYVALMRLGCGVAGSHGMSSLLVSFVFDLVSLFAIVAGLWIVQLATGAVAPWLTPVLVVLAVALPVILAVLFSGVGAAARIARRLAGPIAHRTWVRRVLDFSDDTARSIAAVRRAGITGRVLLLSLAVRAAKYASLYCLFRGIVAHGFALLADLPPAVVVTSLLSAEATASLPVPTFMGFGAYEAGGALALTIFGVSRDTSVLIMLALHIWSQLVDYTLGGLGLVLLLWLHRGSGPRPVATGRTLRWVLATVAAVVLACGIGLAAWQFRTVKKMGSLTPPDPGRTVLLAEKTRIPGMDREKGFVVWSSNRSGNHDIYRMSLPDGRVSPVTRHPHTETFPRVSPDGRRLVFVRSRQPWVSQRDYLQWDVMMVDMDTGEETLLSEHGNAPSWSPDGKRVYFQQDGNRVVELDLATARRRVAFQTGTDDGPPASVLLETPSVSPDGSRLAVTFRGGMRATALLSPGGAWEVLGDGCQLTWGPDGRYLYKVDKGGRQTNAIFRVDPTEGGATPWLDLPGDFSHEYFPRVSRDGRFMVLGASTGGHEHDTADYEIFLWKIGAPAADAVRLTHHTGNDCWPDIFLEKEGHTGGPDHRYSTAQ